MGKTSNEAKKRYADKTYKQYLVSLRIKEDAELIARIENLRAQGLQTTKAVKTLIGKI